jgi:pentose-5-phosphate-3-epimerase
LRALAKDKDPLVRSSVARNPATPIEVVISLAEDEKYSVKAAVAENPKTPVSVLRKLASI